MDTSNQSSSVPATNNSAAPASEMKAIPVPFLLLATIFCTLITAFGDLAVIGATIHQFRSNSFLPAPCQIVSSKLKIVQGPRSASYEPRVQYTYSVGGLSYTGHIYTFGSFNNDDSAWAHRAIRDFPAGSQRTCYYDARNPSRAVLLRGLQSGDVFGLMFFTPFNVIAGILLYLTLGERYYRKADPKPAAIDAVQNLEAWSMSQYTPLIIFALTFAVASFAGIFICIIRSGFNGPIATVSATWGSAFLLAVAAALFTRRKLKSGKHNLVLDLNKRYLTIPAMHKRPASITLPFEDVQSIQIKPAIAGYGRNRRVNRLHLLTRDGRDLILKDEPIQSLAHRLAEVLSERIGLG
jgi:hypothetical protein